MSDAGGPAGAGAVRVVIADDSALIRHGLEAMLSGQPGLDFAGAGADGDELDELIASADPDVVVTDLRMPPSGGARGFASRRGCAARTRRSASWS